MPLHPEHLARLVADDHAKALALVGHLEARRGNRRALVDVLGQSLALHAGAEEIVLYPALRDLPGGGAGAADAALEEHRVLKDTLVELDRTEPLTPEFEAALTRLVLTFKAHAPEEEQVTLPALAEALGDDRMVALGRQFVEVKRGLPSRAHPFAPDRPPANLLAGVLAPIDRARDRLSGRQRALASDHSGLLDADAQAVVDALGAMAPAPVELLDPEAARRQPTVADAVAAVQRHRGEPGDPQPVGRILQRTVPSSHGAVAVCIYSPEGLGGDHAGPAPVIVYAHGGGWVLANPKVYDATPRALVDATGSIVVSVRYRRAPEHRFPAAHDDVLAVTQWVLDHAGSIGGDPLRVAVAGESVGATMAAATAWQLLHEGDRRLRAQLLVYPVASGEGSTGSYLDSADAVPLNRAMVGWFLKHALDDPAQALDPRIDLVNIPLERLRGLPPAMVITAERDPLRAEGEAFAQRLADAGVEVTAARYEGMPHEFFGTGAVVETARHAVAEAADFLVRHLGAETLSRSR